MRPMLVSINVLHFSLIPSARGERYNDNSSQSTGTWYQYGDKNRKSDLFTLST